MFIISPYLLGYRRVEDALSDRGALLHGRQHVSNSRSIIYMQFSGMWYFDRDFDFDTSLHVYPQSRNISKQKGETSTCATIQPISMHYIIFQNFMSSMSHSVLIISFSFVFVFYIDYSDSDQPTAGKFYFLDLETCCNQVSS